jgi:hypothetical protein
MLARLISFLDEGPTMSANTIDGGCQCGAVRYRITGTPIMTAICHCTMCRRANAAPAVAWAMFKQDDVSFSGTAPKLFASSAEAERGFCANCGTQISFLASFLPGLIDITIGSMDDPEQAPPRFHYHHGTHISWAEFADKLPRYPELPPHAQA